MCIRDREKAEDTGRVTGASNNSAFSTPGNAQLVDDKENDDPKPVSYTHLSGQLI